MPKLAALQRDKFGRGNGILDRRRKLVLRRQAVVDRNQPAARRFGKRGCDTVVGLDAAGHHAAAMEEDETGRGAALIVGRIKPVGDISAGARQDAIGRVDAGRI